jgi:hypothetical protein
MQTKELNKYLEGKHIQTQTKKKKKNENGNFKILTELQKHGGHTLKQKSNVKILNLFNKIQNRLPLTYSTRRAAGNYKLHYSPIYCLSSW